MWHELLILRRLVSLPPSIILHKQVWFSENDSWRRLGYKIWSPFSQWLQCRWRQTQSPSVRCRVMQTPQPLFRDAKKGRVLHRQGLIAAQFYQSEHWPSKELNSWDFPGGPVAKTLSSQCRGPRFHPWSENWILHATLGVRMSQLKIPYATVKTQHRQINTFFKKTTKCLILMIKIQRVEADWAWASKNPGWGSWLTRNPPCSHFKPGGPLFLRDRRTTARITVRLDHL